MEIGNPHIGPDLEPISLHLIHSIYIYPSFHELDDSLIWEGWVIYSGQAIFLAFFLRSLQRLDLLIISGGRPQGYFGTVIRAILLRVQIPKRAAILIIQGSLRVAIVDEGTGRSQLDHFTIVVENYLPWLQHSKLNLGMRVSQQNNIRTCIHTYICIYTKACDMMLKVPNSHQFAYTTIGIRLSCLSVSPFGCSRMLSCLMLHRSALECSERASWKRKTRCKDKVILFSRKESVRLTKWIYYPVKKKTSETGITSHCMIILSL
jgi:hypothetical protein